MEIHVISDNWLCSQYLRLSSWTTKLAVALIMRRGFLQKSDIYVSVKMVGEKFFERTLGCVTKKFVNNCNLLWSVAQHEHIVYIYIGALLYKWHLWWIGAIMSCSSFQIFYRESFNVWQSFNPCQQKGGKAGVATLKHKGALGVECHPSILPNFQ